MSISVAKEGAGDILLILRPAQVVVKDIGYHRRVNETVLGAEMHLVR